MRPLILIQRAARFGTARDAGFCALLKEPAALEPLWSVPKKEFRKYRCRLTVTGSSWGQSDGICHTQVISP